MKVVWITGASSGIGAATARRLAKDGCKVVLIARGVDALHALAAEIGEQAHDQVCDASDGEAVLSVSQRLIEELGVPDVLVNSAGAGQWKRIEHTSPAEGRQMMNAPYFAAFNFSHAVMDGMLKRGSGVIIHVGSPVSIMTWPNSVGYAASRWALRGLNDALNDDLVGTGVQSCHVVFGKVDSPYFNNNPNTEQKVPGISKTIRTLSVQECAEVISNVIQRPRPVVTYPMMLTLYVQMHRFFPRLVKSLLRRTSPRGRG